MAKKDRYWRMLAAAAVVVAFAFGCGGQSAVDHGGSLVSEEGQIALLYAPKANWADLPSSDADV